LTANGSPYLLSRAQYLGECLQNILLSVDRYELGAHGIKTQVGRIGADAFEQLRVFLSLGGIRRIDMAISLRDLGLSPTRYGLQSPERRVLHESSSYRSDLIQRLGQIHGDHRTFSSPNAQIQQMQKRDSHLLRIDGC